jgi:hypothetical protein
MRSLPRRRAFPWATSRTASRRWVARRHLLEIAKAFAAVAAAPDPRRADGAVVAGFRRAPLRLRPEARGRRNGRSSTSPTGSPRFARSPTGSPSCATARFGGHRGQAISTPISRDDHRAHARGVVPAEASPTRTDGAPAAASTSLSGHGFDDISLTAGEGEIVGIAGVSATASRRSSARWPAAACDRVRDRRGKALSRRKAARRRGVHARPTG